MYQVQAQSCPDTSLQCFQGNVEIQTSLQLDLLRCEWSSSLHHWPVTYEERETGDLHSTNISFCTLVLYLVPQYPHQSDLQYIRLVARHSQVSRLVGTVAKQRAVTRYFKCESSTHTITVEQRESYQLFDLHNQVENREKEVCQTGKYG